MGMTIAQFKSLKTTADAEWKRRKYNGSMASYAGKAYTAEAVSGGFLMAADGNLLMTPLTVMINHGNLATSSNGTFIQSSFDNSTISTWLTSLAARAADSSTNDCNSACSGLCVSQCSTGCSGQCTTGCTSCSGGCTSCTGCSGGCSGCTGGCQGCGSGCASTCSGTCRNCAGANCSGGCQNGCSSCTGGCSGSCTNCSNCAGSNCSGGCQGTTKKWV